MKKIIVASMVFLSGCASDVKVKHVEPVDDVKKEFVSGEGSNVDWDVEYTSGSELLKLIDSGEVKPGYIFKSYVSVEMDLIPIVDGSNVRMNALAYGGIEYELIAGKLGQDYLVFDMPGRVQKNNGSYVGSNSFGVRKKIDKVSVVEYMNAVKVNNKSDSPYGIKIERCIIPSYDVKDDGSNLKIEYIAKLLTNSYLSDKGRMGPTMDFTIDAKIQKYFFESKVISARVVNIKTKKIYNCSVVI